MWYSGHSNKVTRITCIFPHTSPKLLSYIFFSVTEKLCKNGLRIPISKHFFLFRNSLLLMWKKFIFLWCKICSASSLQSDYYSCSCVYRKQHWCNCCQVEPRLFFFSEIYLQMCPLLAFPTVFDIIMVPHSKSSSFLLLSTTIYQAHWNEKHKTESFWCPWAREKWNSVIWNSNCSCSWILQCHLVILFLSRELFCIYFGRWAQKPH